MVARYKQLIKAIELFQPKVILETGTWNGDRAIQMVQTALKFNDNIHYIGYDLFEQATHETDEAEKNVKQHYSLADVQAKLEKFASNVKGNSQTFTFELHRGNTRETITKMVNCDFAYIDGGHSIKTIKHEYDFINAKVYVFDDYYAGDIIDISIYGCNKVINHINHGAFILPIKDPVAGGGFVQMALVIA